jgi:hypothetical protein
MSFQEVKGTLAKLLATEDLIIEHRQVETASFDVSRRLLTLPVWKDAGEAVYDMLVAHEVAHALFTPNTDFDVEVSKSFVNITEDVRVEKLMKRKYPGLPKSFFRGYQELNDRDFFMIKDKNVNKMNLADKINLYFKVGNFLNIRFTPPEKVIVDLVANAETFEEAVAAAKVLYDYVNNNEGPASVIDQAYPKSGSDAPEGFVDDISSDDDKSGDSEEDADQEADLETPSYELESDQGGEEETPTTQDSFDSNLSKLADKDPFYSDKVYVTRPKVDLDQIIIDNERCHNLIAEHWNRYDGYDCFSEIDSTYRKFKDSAQKEVNYLVKEFECKKSADEYLRSTTSRTGVLDCTKLHSYKYSEDLFKRVTVVPNGKNHGLLFILDWSGSMSDCIFDTIKQLYNLVWFCRKVGIPYDVYAFTSENKWDESQPKPYKREDNVFHISEYFGLFHMLTSSVNSKESEKQLLNLWRVVCSFGRASLNNKHIYAMYSAPPLFGLSGTPLNETIISLHQIIPLFTKKYNLQNVNVVILTDGEAAPLYNTVWVTYKTSQEEGRWGCRSWSAEKFILRDRKIGYMKNMGEFEWEFTKTLLDNLKANFPHVNLMGIRLGTKGDCSRMIRAYSRYMPTKYTPQIDILSKTKTLSLSKVGYDKYFLLLSNTLSVDSEFEVEEGAKKSQIKSAFRKSLASKKVNKKILNEFIELIA